MKHLYDDITARYHRDSDKSETVNRRGKPAAMLFLHKLDIFSLLVMVIVETDSMSLSTGELKKLDRNVVQMYEMVHVKVNQDTRNNMQKK